MNPLTGQPETFVNAFLPRDAMPSQDVRLSVHLSVRPSVTRRYSVEMAKVKHIIKVFFSPSDSHTILVFIARQHTDARYWYSNSVRLSVRHVPVSDENGLTYYHNFFHHSPVAQHQTYSRNCDGVTPSEGAKYRWSIKISRFFINKSLYLADDTR